MGFLTETFTSRFPAIGMGRLPRGVIGGEILLNDELLESSYGDEAAPQFVPVEGVHYLPRIDGRGHKFTREGRKIAKDYWQEYEKREGGENYTDWLAARMNKDESSNNQDWVALMQGSFARRLRAQEVNVFLKSEKNGVTWGKVIVGPGGTNYVNAMRAMRAESQIKMALEIKNLEDEKTVETRAMGLMALALVEVLAGENPKTAWRETVELSSALEMVGEAEREIKAEQDLGNLNNYGGVKLEELSETDGVSPETPLGINNGVLEEGGDSQTVEKNGGIIPALPTLIEGGGEMVVPMIEETSKTPEEVIAALKAFGPKMTERQEMGSLSSELSPKDNAIKILMNNKLDLRLDSTGGNENDGKVEKDGSEVLSSSVVSIQDDTPLVNLLKKQVAILMGEWRDPRMEQVEEKYWLEPELSKATQLSKVGDEESPESIGEALESLAVVYERQHEGKLLEKEVSRLEELYNLDHGMGKVLQFGAALRILRPILIEHGIPAALRRRAGEIITGILVDAASVQDQEYGEWKKVALRLIEENAEKVILEVMDQTGESDFQKSEVVDEELARIIVPGVLGKMREWSRKQWENKKVRGGLALSVVSTIAIPVIYSIARGYQNYLMKGETGNVIRYLFSGGN